MDLFLVETRTVRIAQHREIYLSCDYVFFASTLERAEFWMQSQMPDNSERFYYAVVRVPVDLDTNFELVGYYTLLGERSTQERCVEFLTRKRQ
jgi:hypothetical protein